MDHLLGGEAMISAFYMREFPAESNKKRDFRFLRN